MTMTNSLSHSLLYSAKTEFNADCVSWCPFEGHKMKLACCMYETVDEGTKETPDIKRFGGLEIFDFAAGFDSPTSVLSYQSSSGIFRIKWLMINGVPEICGVDTDGYLRFYSANNGTEIEVLNRSVKVSSGTLSCFDLDQLNSPQTAVCSDNQGYIFSVDLESGKSVDSFLAHSYPYDSTPAEIWSVTMDSRKNVVYSGADDSLFKCWDFRASNRRPISVNKSHSAGVTKILIDNRVSDEIITGSYDENIRIFDSRNLKSPLYELKTPGGVWDMDFSKFDSLGNRETYSKSINLAAACMQGGWEILKKDNDGLKEVLICGPCEKVLYGVSFCSSDREVLAVCSFYDKKLDIIRLKCK